MGIKKEKKSKTFQSRYCKKKSFNFDPLCLFFFFIEKQKEKGGIKESMEIQRRRTRCRWRRAADAHTRNWNTDWNGPTDGTLGGGGRRRVSSHVSL